MSEAESILVARCRAGEAAAWDELFDQQYDPVGRFLYQLCPELTPEDVEDLCQEVFLSAVRNLAAFQGRSALQTWLFRIAMNKARDWIEKRHAAKRGGGRAPISLDAPDPETGRTVDRPGEVERPDEALDRLEAGRQVRAALDRLGDPCRELIELRYFGDLSHAELARELGISVKAAGSRLHTCLGRLAELYRGTLAVGEDGGIPSNH